MYPAQNQVLTQPNYLLSKVRADIRATRVPGPESEYVEKIAMGLATTLIRAHSS